MVSRLILLATYRLIFTQSSLIDPPLTGILVNRNVLQQFCVVFQSCSVPFLAILYLPCYLGISWDWYMSF